MLQGNNILFFGFLTKRIEKYTDDVSVHKTLKSVHGITFKIARNVTCTFYLQFLLFHYYVRVPSICLLLNKKGAESECWKLLPWRRKWV